MKRWRWEMLCEREKYRLKGKKRKKKEEKKKFKKSIAKQRRLRRFQIANYKRAINNPNENWMLAKLEGRTRYCWIRQYVMGNRIFDFYCEETKIAVEVDGEEHDMKFEAYRDAYYKKKYGVTVIRVKNRCEEDAEKCIERIVGYRPELPKPERTTMQRVRDKILNIKYSPTIKTAKISIVRNGVIIKEKDID